MHRRSRQDIIADILVHLHEPIGKTRVMYGANLSYEQIQDFLSQLQRKNVVQKTSDGKWVLTEKGRKLAELYQASRRLNLELKKLVED
jgi:predicted transcriptional regulator